MRYNFTPQRKVAIVMLGIWSFNLLTPTMTYALTSGPAAPESKAFQPAGVSDMVDLSSGDFKYNIPLLDIDGYPINLSYQSAVGMDDEASWVGLGWSLNPGAINRQVRGVPDDMAGDATEVDHWTKPKVTVGGKASLKFEAFGALKVNGSFTVGLFNDNYTGIGAEVGVNAGMSFGLMNNGMLTSSLGLGLTSNTQSGVDVNPNVSLSIRDHASKDWTERSGLSASLGYNSRSGMKSLSLGTTFDVSGQVNGNSGQGSYSLYGSTISYNTEPLSPSTQLPYQSSYDSFSFDVGAAVFGGFPGIGGTGYRSVRQVASFANVKNAYGFLYAERGKHDLNAQMDFIREKDNPIIKGIPNIAIPIHTPDLWSYTNQAGSGQFRLYRGGTGAFFDNLADDQSDVHTSGGDIGAGQFFHGGYTHFDQTTHNTTRKWETDNGYLSVGDFQSQDFSAPYAQHVYFRQVGEKNVEDEEVNPKVYNDQALRVNTDGMTSTAGFQTAGNVPQTAAPITKLTTKRENRTEISYLTEEEAVLGALDKVIPVYDFNTYGSFTAPANNKPVPSGHVYRNDNVYRKKLHISEMTVTDDGGKRMVYGIPVYNKVQTETSFAVSPLSGLTTYDGTGLVNVPSDVTSPLHSQCGIDNYFHQEKKPAYASSFLLTAILSPDYVDKTGDGITDDDQGTAIKFNYSKIDNFRWRAPYERATLNKGLLADPDDDKGSVVYGEKELWYVHSIETKTKVIYFITADRDDALGVQSGWQTGGKDLSQRQKYLKEIRLYSKADTTRPIKVVKFAYDYTLCPRIPNSATGLGKLTLRQVWFEYGNSTKGSAHKYSFDYNTDAIVSNVGYDYMMTDRWGNYKTPAQNPNGVDNEHYPYADQSSTANINAGLWRLKQIKTPTGGTINVNYEAGDYAYVQDKKASVMQPIQSLMTGSSSATDLTLADGLKIPISHTDATTGAAQTDQLGWFKSYFLNGSDYLYTKLYVNFQTDNNKHANGATDPDRWNDYVPCFAKLTGVSIDAGSNTATVTFAGVSDGGVTNENPMAIAAWQKLKNEYPRYAYPGFDNRELTAKSGVIAAVGAIVTAAKNMSELLTPFYKKAQNKHYCKTVDPNRSFVRLVKTDGKKIGGPARVKQIQINDNWNTMSTSSNAASSTYGQAYTYTKIENGQPISSGVAAYEPAIGSDENSLKEPVQYVQTVAGGISNFFELDKPFCESLYPAPQIVYSKVTVNDLGADHLPSTNTGYTVSEFYTARDFPVKVTVLPLIDHPYTPNSYYTLLGSSSVDELSLTQGYSIELNDMHGKPKANRIYNKAGSEISSTEYYYNAVDNGGTMSLNNKVNVIDIHGNQRQRYMGRDIEFFTDLREQESINEGQAINIGGDLLSLFPPIGIPHFPINDNNEYKLFRSACALKVIQNYGIISKVVKTDNGSSITTENLAFDEVTGDAIVTHTQNEFNKSIYSVNMPAYWAYKNMGGSYNTSGVVLDNLQTDPNGVITNDYRDFLTTGDEMTDMATGGRYWVGLNAPSTEYAFAPDGGVDDFLHPAKLPDGVRTIEGKATATNPLCNGCALKKPATAVYNYFLMDVNGAIVRNLNQSGGTHRIKIVRSGFRNMLNAQTFSLVCLNNPIVNNVLQLTSLSTTDLTNLKAINTSATTFDELWAVKPGCNNNHTVEDVTSAYFHYHTSQPHPDHASYGTVIFNSVTSNTSYGTPISTVNYPKIASRFDAAGVWMRDDPWTQANFRSTLAKTIGLETDFNVLIEGDYYAGYGGDDVCTYTLDKGTANEQDMPIPPSGTGLNNPLYYYLCPVHLKAGWHHLTATGYNMSMPDDANNYPSYNPATIVFEIYNLSLTQLKDNSTTYTYGSNVIFSTSADPSNYTIDLANAQASIVKDDGTYYRFNYKYCVNPYVEGFLGNWRTSNSYVLQQNRHYVSDLFSGSNKGVNVKDAGYIQNFTSYWYNPGTPYWIPNTSAVGWTRANTVTLYDKYGQQLENKDALDRYSAANFDFNGELPSAVASNAKNREIYTNSFEDVLFNPGTVVQSCNPVGINELITDHSLISTSVSHSGNNSLLLPVTSGINISTNAYIAPVDNTLLIRTNLGEYNIQRDIHTQQDAVGVYPHGFEPISGNSYIFDIWVNDGSPTDRNANVSLNINSTSYTLTCKAVVEGWKLLETTVTFPAGAVNINIIPAFANIYIDDLRIHPYDSEMKTYVYDSKTLRLMAELDENAFATFYEYDDEGLLIRVKKETEKGVMTLKESKSAYRNQNP